MTDQQLGRLETQSGHQRRSANHFNVRQSPTLVENRLLWAIHTEPREPSLTGLGVKPVGLLTRGRRDGCTEAILFDVTVNLNDPVVARALARHDVGTPLVKMLAEALGKHATQTQKIQLKPEPIRLSETHTFTWCRTATAATHTIFNQVACYNQFEADFAAFLDKAPDVNAFAKLAEWFTGFGLEFPEMLCPRE